jgi:endonuclease/exonuclease/phosphatase family metal-dependent hydrolase
VLKAVRAQICRHLRISRLYAAIFGAASLLAQDYTRDSRPELFTYQELVQLGSNQEISSELSAKLHAVTRTPFINNEAYFRGAKPRPIETEQLGPALRVALWNIERGLHLDNIQLLLTDKDRFVGKIVEERGSARENNARIRDIDLTSISQDIETLKAADVWILNEVDWGVKRSQYREIIRELAETLNMNWAYGVEFIEVDSKQLGTDTFDNGETDQERRQLVEEFRVDKDKLRALHGNAVLSRYPIRSARLVPFTVGYDWFKESTIRPLEKGKRKAAVVIGEDLMREVRRGQRTTLYVDLDVPDAPGARLTIASTHLENRATPRIRRQQMQELLDAIHDIPNPVVVAGDLNTTGGNSTPTSVENMLYKRYGSLDFWTTQGVQWASGVGMIYPAARTAKKLVGIQYRIDPTSANVPGASANLERGLFNTLEKFRFSDGKALDFRGVRERTTNHTAGTLANSNERAGKGFAPTFVTELIWGKVKIAKFKLDWIFVKADIEDPRDVKGSYRFAPHFPRTLDGLNNSMPQPISDHSPMTVDLPFGEPSKLTPKR